MDERGNWRDSALEITEVAVSYFERLYMTSNPDKILEVVEAIDMKVSADMNQILIKQFIRDEVEAALKQMHPSKSPGPDGMPALFYQKYWDIVGSDVMNMILNILNSNTSMADINKTYITLIPKINNPAKMTDFRPISLCNVIYKLISKVLVNRLKLVLLQVISENQSVFLSERLIIDNVLIAFELMHYLDHKREGKDCYMAIKLDMSKAYDRVEWGFIEQVMKKLGFRDSWIRLIMSCITSVSYSLLINGVAFGNIIPLRGLRQDPLSPYLFLLCADDFFSLISKAVRNQMLSGLSICRGCPKITHIFFADDSLLFCKANSQECQQLIEILSLYEAASGQKINADKSSVFFSANAMEEKKIEILEILGPMQDSWHGKYLGLPSIIGKSKNKVFVEIKERVGKKLAGWKEKILSIGGKETLIKVVAQAIPSYAMSCFQLPKGLCDDTEGMMRRFWWGQRGHESKIAWVSWK